MLGNLIVSRQIDHLFLSNIIAFEGILIGVSIPISLQVAAWISDRYDDPEMGVFFIKDKIYRLQYFVFFLNILIAIYFRFIIVKDKLLLAAMFSWAILNVYFFYKFILLIERFLINLHGVIIDKSEEMIDEILKEN